MRPADPAGRGGRLVDNGVHRGWLIALLGLALVSAGCGASSGAGSTARTRTAASTTDSNGTVRVVMKSLDFSPTVVHARVGDAVTWFNEDGAPHNVTYVSGPRFQSSGPTIRPRAKFTVTLTEAGIVRYYCTIHPWMKAAIVVSR